MDFTQLFLFEVILMRMSGFVMFSPLYSRTNVPALFKTGLSLLLAVFVYSYTAGTIPPVPTNVLQFTVIMLVELCIGLTIGLIMRLFLLVVQFGGEIMDVQMGFSMAKMYDPSSQANLSLTASLLNVLFVVIFFVQNGHYTLLRILITSSEIIPYGTAQFGTEIAQHVAQIFFDTILLSVKIALPIMAAEIFGIVGMGILMKAIPQINAFVINLELKVILGLTMIFLFLIPMSEYILSIEVQMLKDIQNILVTLSG